MGNCMCECVFVYDMCMWVGVCECLHKGGCIWA